MREINITDFETMFSRLLDKLKFESDERGFIQIESDWYKQIPSEIWNKHQAGWDYDSSPVEIGSLYDDVDMLLKHRLEEERPFTFVDFDRLSSVLKEISQRYNPV